MIAISVIIPTFNRAGLVTEAIQSVLRQNVDGLEIIVVDDGSTDDTHAAVARFGDCCRYVHQANLGPAAARNTGMALASGEMIALLDSDDIWRPDKLATELRLFEQYPQADMLAGDAAFFLEGRPIHPSIFARRGVSFIDSQPRWFDWSIDIMTVGPVCTTSAMTFRRSVLDKVGSAPFDAGLRLDEDWDLEFRLFSSCKGLLHADVVCHVRAFDDGTRPYSVWGKPRPKTEQRHMWSNQVAILERYLDHMTWDAETRRRFVQRRDELRALLA